MCVLAAIRDSRKGVYQQMFDTNHVSNMLKNARVKKNLTQSALAEKLGVTYQAVSNWERGNSLPDISNLPAICQILDVNLYVLLGASQGSEFVNKVLSGSYDLTGESIENIVSMAPMIPPEQLITALKNNDSPIRDMSVLIQIAPFVDGDTLEELGKNVVPTNFGEIIALTPFVSGATCAKWIDMLDSIEECDLDVGLLSALGPFLPTEKMDRLSERVIPDTLVVLDSVAPFLSQAALDNLANRLDSISLDDYLVGVQCLAPFLSKETLMKLHQKVVNE